MPAVPQFSPGNRILQALSVSDFELLAPQLMPVLLHLGQDLEEPNKRIAGVYFPDSGVASVIALHPDGTRVEIGVVGPEGVTGMAVLLGNERSPHATTVQIAGRGLRIAARDLRNAMTRSPSLQTLLHKYVQAFLVQTAQTAVANARATLPQRLARWLLMAHDRVSADKLPLTHKLLALMMGVRRAGVTEALHELARLKLTSASRGEIILLNRKGLEKLAGNFYGVPEAEYGRLLA
jgi:CRP-like cAMP-binding protein